MWDLIEAKVTGSALRPAVAGIDELAPPGDAELDGRRADELAGRFRHRAAVSAPTEARHGYGTTPDGAPVLVAMRTLAKFIRESLVIPGCGGSISAGRSRPDRRVVVSAGLCDRPPGRDR